MTSTIPAAAINTANAAKNTASITVANAAMIELLEGVLTHAGKDKSLPLLNTIAIESSGGEVIARATDRYRLIEGRVEQVNDLTGSLPITLIPVDDVKKIITLAKAAKADRYGYVKIEREGERVSARYLDQEIIFRAYDGTFPPTDQLWPAEDTPRVPVEKVSFNPTFFSDYGKIVGKKGAVTVEFTDNNSPMRKPIIIGLTGEKVTWRALLMPMRIA